MRVEPLEDRTVPTTITEVEPNDTFATAQGVPIATGDVTTTAAADWLIIQGSVASGPDADYFSFTLSSPSGVFFDLDSRDTGLSTILDSVLTLYNSGGAEIPGASNDDGYDFEGFAVPAASTGSATSRDASLYFDLAAGTYAIRLTSFSSSTTGNYNLRLLADSTYSASPPVFHSNAGAADTLYLDFDGYAATDDWGTYTAAPYDFNGVSNQFSPAERLAIQNTWKGISEDYSPFAIDITTAAPAGAMAAGQSFRMVYTNSDAGTVGQSNGILGVSYVGVYGADPVEYRTSFTFAGNFSTFGGGTSGQIVAKPVEMGNTSAHEFGHALGLLHYASSSSPGAIMATPDLGLNRERWTSGLTTPNGSAQDDMAVIAGAVNTFGYRADDHAASTGTATVLTATGNTYAAAGRIERVTDTDWFRFTGSGDTTVTVDVSDYTGDLDVILRLRDAAGGVIETNGPAGPLDASITRTLAHGIYYLSVEGTGAAGIAGQYAVRIDTVVLAPPALSGIEAAALAYTENQTLAVTATLAVADPDSANLQGATVSVSAGYAAGQDVLDFTTQNGITGSYASGTLTLTGTASLANYQTALRSVQYRNSSENPSTAARTVAFRVTDPDGNQSTIATRTITVTAVNDAPVADADAYSTNEDTPLTIAAGTGVLDGDTDPEGTALTAVLGDTVQHGTLTLNPNGSFTYTPAANYTGTDAFTYRASDANLTSNLATVTLTITAVNDAPAADNDAYTVAEDGALAVAAGDGVLIGDADVEGSALTAVLVGDVQHGTLSLNLDGSFTYTPAANYNGPDTFTYRASDGTLTSNLATVTLTVSPVNDAPVADTDAYATNEDVPLTVAAGPGVLDGDTDIDGDTLTAVLVDNVQHGTLALATNGSFTYTPAANYNGSDSFTYRASDGSATSNLATVTLTINPVNDAPVADADAYSVNEDGTLTVPAGTGVLTGDTDVEGSALTAVLVDTVQHGTLALAGDGSFVYTPTANYTGPDSFTYRASDGNLTSNLATVTLTVTAVNDAPVADNDAYSIAEDGTLTVAAGTGVLDGDTDVDGDTLTAVLVGDVQHGTLTLNADGSFTYTPAADYNGPDTFTYRAADGGLTSNLATVTLTIAGVNDAPVADNEAYTVAEDGIRTVAAGDGVLIGDTDLEGTALTAVLVGDVQHGSLSLNLDGSFTYTPAANYTGTDAFTYRASDGSATSNLATVILTVSPVNDAPVADNDAYATNEDTSLTVAAGTGVLDGDTDIDGDSLTAVLVGDVQHGTLNLSANGSFTYTPAANYTGPDTFTYRASDGTLTSNLATVTLTIAGVNDAPVAQPNSYTLAEDAALTVGAPGVLGDDTDIDGDLLTAVPGAGPAHGSLALNADGSFTYTPAADYNGPDSFTYRAGDGTSTSGLVTVNLTVTPVNDAPVAVAESATTPEDVPLVVGAPGVLGNDTDGDGDPLTAVPVAGPAHGSLTLNPDGSYTYTPAADYNGPDSFTYRATDGSATSAAVTVTLTVPGVNDAPTPGDDAAALPLKKSVTISVLANDSDPEGNPISLQSFNQPTKGTVKPVGNTLVYTSAGPLAGADSFTYTVVDSLGAAATATVRLTLTDPVAPALTAVRARYGTAGSADLKGIGRTNLPWAGLARFELAFSEDAIPAAGALTLTGPAGAVPLVPGTVPATGAKLAVWTFPALAPGRYTLRLTGTGVRDINGNPLRVGYTRTFGILPGDFDGNGVVNSVDLTGIKKKYQANPAKADRFADVNGDGVVNALDYNLAKAALGTRLR